MSNRYLSNTLSELGLSVDPMPREVGNLPPGNAKWTVAHYSTFAAVWNTYNRTYPANFDEAVRDCRANALAMRRDPVISGAMRKLTTPVCQLPYNFKPRRADDQQLKEDADIMKDIFDEFPRPGFQQLVRMLMESRFLGRAGVSALFKWVDDRYHPTRLEVDHIRPVNGDKIVFKWDDTPGILTNPIGYDGTLVTTERGYAHFLTKEEREVFFYSEFEPTDADYMEGQFAGWLHGQGFRGLLYWPWTMRQQVWQTCLRFLRRSSAGFNVATFDYNGPISRDQLAAELKEYDSEDFLLFPRTRGGEDMYSLTHNAVSLTGAQIYLDIMKWLDGIMEDYILGEELSTGTAPTGMGSGVAEGHQDTADDRTKYQASDMEVAIQPLVDVLSKYNAPGRPPCKFEFMVEKRNPQEYMAGAQFAYSMGVAIDEDDLREVLALPKPKDGSGIVAQMSPGQPAAMADAPQGMPVAGTPGPEQSGAQQPPGAMDGQANDPGQQAPGVAG